MPLGLTPVLATFTGQVASWQLQDLSSAISAYAGTTARVVFRYESGNSYTGDLQLDAITLGGTTAGFESGIDSYQTSTSSDGGTSTYSSVTSWTSLATTTLEGRWDRWTGNTPSADTGDLGAYAGSYFVYAETTTPGYPSKYFWLRGPEIVVTPATLEFALGRQGATIGTLKVYLDITASNVTISFSGWGRSGWGEQAFGEGSSSLVATGSLGSVTVQAAAIVSVTGLSATSALGATTQTGIGNVDATGVVGSSAVGSVAVTADALFSVTGVQGTSALGSETAFTSVDIAVTGVSATGIANYSVWDAVVYLGGWGRAGWGDFGFGTDSISVQGTGEIGSVEVQEGASVVLTGVEATIVLGNTAVNADGAISALGNAATGEIGTVEINAGAIVAVTGVVGTTALGTAGVQGSVIVNATGVAGTTVLGTVSVTADAIVTETGLQATSALGSVTVELTLDVLVTGVQGTTALGETTETADANVYAIGVQATGQVGTVLVWSRIVPGGDPIWIDIAPSGDPQWTDIAA
jgi:hypothetical protein